VVTRGRLNNQTAFDLGISDVMVKLRRANVMRKMEVRSVGELIGAWETDRDSDQPQHQVLRWLRGLLPRGR
jgi:FixJ family two-component response regulator